MRGFKNFWLSLAAPFLVLIGILGLFHRKDNDRVQSIPALAIGSGLIISSVWSHKRRRKQLLVELNKSNDDYS